MVARGAPRCRRVGASLGAPTPLHGPATRRRLLVLLLALFAMVRSPSAAETSAPEKLTRGQSGSYSVAFGSRKSFELDVPAGLSELAFVFASDGRVRMSTRPDSALTFEIPASGAQASPLYYDAPSAELKNVSAYAAREVSYANTRGQTTSNIVYLVGPRRVYLHVSGGLQPREAFEDATLPFSLRVDVKAARATCVDGTQALDSGAQTLSFGEMHFYSIRVPASWPYLHVEMLGLVDKADMLLSSTVNFPLDDGEAFQVSKDCGNCAHTHSRRKLGARPEDWPETGACLQGDALAGACAGSTIPNTEDTPTFIHVVARSTANADRTSQYRMLAWVGRCRLKPVLKLQSAYQPMLSALETGIS